MALFFYVNLFYMNLGLKTYLYTFFYIIGFFFCFVIGSFFYFSYNHAIDFCALEHYDPGRPSIVLDDLGQEWTRFQLDKRTPVELKNMPPHLIQAFLAAEDWHFFKHSGLSWKGIVRSLLINIYHGKKIQGASTITQQLVKLLFFDLKKTYTRKIKEQLCAILVERQFSKEQILQTYLNHVCFGCGIYGVQAASQRFWNKSVCDISLAQAATLAGIVRAPARYCPLSYALSAQARRNTILQQMLKLQFITQEQYEQASNTDLTVYDSKKNHGAPHLRESIRIFLEKKFGKKQLYTGGLIVQTTLNQELQKKAEQSFAIHIKKLREDLCTSINGAFISIDSKTAQIKALIGGFGDSYFNRAFQAKRQMGSTFKPLIYAEAIKQGMNFSDKAIDEQIEVLQYNQSWKPKNYNNQFSGEITLAYALSHSSNIVAIKTLLKIGTQPVIDLAKKVGLQGPFHHYPSLALGCIDATLKEVSGMFNVFANNGIFIEPYCIKWVKNRWGTKLYQTDITQIKALSSRITGQVAQVLTHGILRFKKWYPHWPDAQIISKTGTTNDSRTCWFAGSTPELTTAVYIGCDDNRSMGKNVYPIGTAFPIWLHFNNNISHTIKTFTFDPHLKEIIINQKTGTIESELTPDSVSIFI